MSDELVLKRFQKQLELTIQGIVAYSEEVLAGKASASTQMRVTLAHCLISALCQSLGREDIWNKYLFADMQIGMASNRKKRDKGTTEAKE